MKPGVRVAAALCFVASLLAPLTTASATDEAAQYRALAERLATLEALGAPAKIDLIPGRVGSLPVTVPVPRTAHVVGTVVRTPQAPNEYGSIQFTQYQLFFDVAQDPREIVDTIVNAVAAQGYTRAPSIVAQRGGFSEHGGFVANAFGNAMLCKGSGDPSITLRAVRYADRTQVTVDETLPLKEFRGGGTPCGNMLMFHPPPIVDLPRIEAFDGVEIGGANALSSFGESSQSANVTTNLGARTLVAKWVEQIQAQGWKQEATAGNDDAGVATFTRANSGTELVALVLSRTGARSFIAGLTASHMQPETATPIPQR